MLWYQVIAAGWRSSGWCRFHETCLCTRVCVFVCVFVCVCVRCGRGARHRDPPSRQALLITTQPLVTKTLSHLCVCVWQVWLRSAASRPSWQASPSSATRYLSSSVPATPFWGRCCGWTSFACWACKRRGMVTRVTTNVCVCVCVGGH